MPPAGLLAVAAFMVIMNTTAGILMGPFLEEN
jgi:hypothetical protein